MESEVTSFKVAVIRRPEVSLCDHGGDYKSAGAPAKRFCSCCRRNPSSGAAPSARPCAASPSTAPSSSPTTAASHPGASSPSCAMWAFTPRTWGSLITASNPLTSAPTSSSPSSGSPPTTTTA
uniref:Uncharacterized protein n=1 Tax=Arundo donax TaxID=35708 RepID=A0A0A9D6U9_ARUDO